MHCPRKKTPILSYYLWAHQKYWSYSCYLSDDKNDKQNTNKYCCWQNGQYPGLFCSQEISQEGRCEVGLSETIIVRRCWWLTWCRPGLSGSSTVCWRRGRGWWPGGRWGPGWRARPGSRWYISSGGSRWQRGSRLLTETAWWPSRTLPGHWAPPQQHFWWRTVQPGSSLPAPL